MGSKYPFPNHRGKVIFSAPMPDGTIRRYHGEAGSLLFLIRIWNLERAGKLKISGVSNA